MDDAAIVGHLNCPRQGFDKRCCLLWSRQRPGQALSQTAALNVFQNQKRPAVVAPRKVVRHAVLVEDAVHARLQRFERARGCKPEIEFYVRFARDDGR